MQFAVWSALLLCACFAVGTVRSGALIVNSINAIKSQMMIPINAESPPTPGTPSHGLGPLLILEDMAAVESSHSLQLDPIQSLTCSADAECSGGFCLAARGACLPCKRRRKRCTRDAMCCHGNQCSNGVCGPVESDIVQQFSLEDVVVTSPTSTLINSTSSASGSSSSSSAGTSSTSTSSNTLLHMNDHEAGPTVALPVRGLEGDGCLRSSDCSDGLCCARHFWSKICKPVLREGQVCTKHKKKGALGLEIFQRCDCGAGLVCRTQRELHELRLNRGARSLHTCQQH